MTTAARHSAHTRRVTIEEACRFLVYTRPSLRKRAAVMFMHLIRLADNHHCVKYGRYIVPRYATSGWGGLVQKEVTLKEVAAHLPLSRKRYVRWHLSSTDTWALQQARDYYDTFCGGSPR